jgi:sugar lactone lactonase YvrE
MERKSERRGLRTAVRSLPLQQPVRASLMWAGLALLIILAMLLVSASPAGAAAKPFPEIIPLPGGFAPEGIAVGRGHNFYVGSIPTGAIFHGDLRTGEGDLLVPSQEGRAAIGLWVDDRTNYLYVAGGDTGQGYVYDAGTGAEVAVFQLTDPGTFVNDVVVTRDAAYFTDSFRPFLYRVPLANDGSIPAGSTPEEIPLGGDFTQVPGFNTNGIDATPNGKWLVIVNSALGALYRVDPETGVATGIDLGGDAVPFGDGILLDGKTLYVVQNQLNQIAVVELSPDLTAGQVVDTITHDEFDVPTTVAEFGSNLYVVNARFGRPVTPDTEYWVVQVSK